MPSFDLLFGDTIIPREVLLRKILYFPGGLARESFPLVWVDWESSSRGRDTLTPPSNLAPGVFIFLSRFLPPPEPTSHPPARFLGCPSIFPPCRGFHPGESDLSERLSFIDSCAHFVSFSAPILGGFVSDHQ